MNFSQLWGAIQVDLSKARNTLPPQAADHPTIRQYEEFIAHNELDLAWDRREDSAADYTVSRGFWLFLRGAANRDAVA
jgi:hypothetical protein